MAHKADLTGVKFAFTGSLQFMTRDEAKKLIKTRNGKFSASVTEDTNYLVAGTDSEHRRSNVRAQGAEG